MKIGRICLTESIAADAKPDKWGEEVEKVVSGFFEEASQFITVVAGDPDQLRSALLRLCDEEKCPLVLTLGGTGPGLRDIAPEVSRSVFDRELPGFGEIMRYYSYERVKNAALSRATGGIRGQSLIINFPSRPKGVKFCLKLLQEAIAEGLEYLTGTRPVLRGDEIVVPMEKFLPFLKRFRIKPDPRGEHPSIRL